MLRVARGRPLPLRRSRGAVPSVLALPLAAPPARAGVRRRAQEHVLPRHAAAARGSCHHIGDLKNVETLRLVRGGGRALRAPVRGRARGRRARPAPGLPLDHVRARPRGRRAHRGAAPPRPPRRRAGRARRDRRRRSARSSTAPGSGPTARSGAASCWSGDLRGCERGGHLWPVRLPGGDRAVARAVADGVRVAGGGRVPRRAAASPASTRGAGDAVARMARPGSARR